MQGYTHGHFILALGRIGWYGAVWRSGWAHLAQPWAARSFIAVLLEDLRGVVLVQLYAMHAARVLVQQGGSVSQVTPHEWQVQGGTLRKGRDSKTAHETVFT